MINLYNYQRKVLLLSPYPQNIKNIVESYGDKVDILNEKINASFVKENGYDFIVSFGYLFLLDRETLEAPNKASINLHISFLPFNRGKHPNVWSNIESTPSGVTIHLIDEGIDTGNILFQKEVYIEKNEHTFYTSYKLLISEIENLFRINWCHIRTNESRGWKQKGIGTFHNEKDIEIIKPFLRDGWDSQISEVKNNYLNWLKKND